MSSYSVKNELMPAFVNEVDESQAVFRHLLKIMSEPGTIVANTFNGENEIASNNIKHQDDSDSFIADKDLKYIWPIALSLLDHDCQIYIGPSLNSSIFTRSLVFHTGASVTDDKAKADFVFISLNELGDIEKYNLGELEAPHKSSTVVIFTEEISDDKQIILSGPGIKSNKNLSIKGLNATHIRLLQANNQFYPCGLDFIFCSPSNITAIPRTTKIKASVGSC
jgi:alpha-D-ribose 1-methylphosphonate 5-triphosphate synthase subunit PhnH